MLRLLLAMMLGCLAGTAYGDGSAHVVQKFDGMDTNTTTATFTVQDKWEVLWFSPRPINITLLAADGTVITGVQGALKGSFYQPKGGTFYIQLNSSHPEAKVPWQLVVAEVGAGTILAGADANPMLSNPGDPNYAPPASILPPGASAQSAAPANPGAQANPFAQNSSPQTNVTPTPAAAPTPTVNTAPVVKLTDDQARAVVLIKGDNAEGTGFLIKTPDGAAVVTNIHVIANNPNLKITTNTGAFVTMLSAKGASDRDLALLSVKEDPNFNYLEVSTDISQTVQPGDAVVTPGNSEGGEVMLNTQGKVLGIGPERIEFDNPIYHGNSGGPVFHLKSGKVLGVVTEAIKVDVSNDLDKTSFASRNSAISGSMRYFGLRLDTVSAWVPIDWRQFGIETAFLDQFHEQSLRLDSYLNSAHDSTDADSKLYLNDEKITKATDRFQHDSSGSDTGQQLEALRGLLFDLQGIADNNMDQIKDMNNFYSFDKDRAQDEFDYRKALKAELDAIGNNVTKLGSLPRTNSN